MMTPRKTDKAVPYNDGMESFRRSILGLIRGAVTREQTRRANAREPKLRVMMAPASFGDYLSEGALVERLKAACEEAGSRIKWAETNGISRYHVSEVINGFAVPSPSLASALGFRPVRFYEPVKKASERQPLKSETRKP